MKRRQNNFPPVIIVVKSCGPLYPPENSIVSLPCYVTFGSTCTLDCMDGYIAFGSNTATCRLTNSSVLAWDIGNFTCEGTLLFLFIVPSTTKG